MLLLFLFDYENFGIQTNHCLSNPQYWQKLFFFKSTMFTIASMILDNEPAPITVVANIYRRYDMDSLSALLVLCEGGPMVIYKQHVTRTLMFSLILA